MSVWAYYGGVWEFSEKKKKKKPGTKGRRVDVRMGELRGRSVGVKREEEWVGVDGAVG